MLIISAHRSNEERMVAPCASAYIILAHRLNEMRMVAPRASVYIILAHRSNEERMVGVARIELATPTMSM